MGREQGAASRGQEARSWMLAARSGVTEEGEAHVDEAVIRYTVVRSARRTRTIAITVDTVRGVVIAAPLRASKQSIRDLVARRADWIRKRMEALSRIPPTRRFQDGETVPVGGREVPLKLVEGTGRVVRLRAEASCLRITIPHGLGDDQQSEAIRRVLATWYRRRAASAVGSVAERWSPIMGVTPRAVLVRDQKRRWGSCSADDVIRINWRLAMADEELLEYVVVHELAHLAVRNHSPAFWDVVAGVLPDHRERRRRLNEWGPRAQF